MATELQRRGFTVVKGALSAPSNKLQEWCDDVFAMGMLGEARKLDSVWHHFERVEGVAKTALTRSENFATNHKGFKKLLTGPDSPVAAVVGAAFGKPVTLYKEKINYKLPGGGGYRAHQDAPAYVELKHHLTCLVPIDPMDETNGCLEFAAGEWDSLLATTSDGVIEPSVADQLEWTPVPLAAGDVVVFSSYVPHRSRPNRSGRPRRALYLTFNASEDGDHRAAYYANKASKMQHDRLSLINHFAGQLVTGADEVVAAVRALFAARGDTQYDPMVTQVEHALQSAALARRENPHDHEMVTAALLHDVGHLVLDENDNDASFLKQDLQHEQVGCRFLAPRFPERVAQVVLLHVPAKRYLCGTDAAYYDGLSSASKRSLALQGRPFSPSECEAFARKPHAMDAVRVRRWDDLAKVRGKRTPPLEDFMRDVAIVAARASPRTAPAARL